MTSLDVGTGICWFHSSPSPSVVGRIHPHNRRTTFVLVQLGADSGGTFTDLVGADGRILKIPSTPADPGAAVRDGIARAGREVDVLAHGTTVATNALLERRGAVVTLVTNEGLTDLVEVARQARPSLYDPWVDRPRPLVARDHRIAVGGRLDASGRELEPVDTDLPSLPEDTEAVAVCLLHADLEPAHERAVAEQLRSRGHDVSVSHEIAPEFREYERTVTTVVNAYLRPVCTPYLTGLGAAAPAVRVMSSGGGLLDAATAAELPAALLLSGPAGGVRAAAEVATACGWPDAIGVDMGGTSTDVGLVLGGAPAPAAVREVAGFPIRLPSLDVHTIGAGGGSIAELDAGGALQVGPASAGADPGPVCYGLGGTRPTVTDANLCLGRIPAGTSFPGLGRLDEEAAARSFARHGIDPAGVIDVVNANMEAALRTVSVERGIDPAGLAVLAFGGAGPLHACELADAIGSPAVIVPGAAGVLSAVGLLISPMRRELVRSWNRSLDTSLGAARAELAETARQQLAARAGVDPGAIEVESTLDVRYAGQSHELRVAEPEDFAAVHEQVNGYRLDGRALEVTALRCAAVAPAGVRIDEVLDAVTPFEPVTGPKVVARDDCTVWVPAGWAGRPGPLGSLVLERT